jgi:hypothetical protein
VNKYINNHISLSVLHSQSEVIIDICCTWVVMLSQGSIHFRQELINLISYVKRGGYRAMSKCSKYQLLPCVLIVQKHFRLLHMCPKGKEM